MMKTLLFGFRGFIAVCCVFTVIDTAAQPSSIAGANCHTLLQRQLKGKTVDQPLLFTENKGQVADENFLQRREILFIAAAGNTTAFIGAGQINYQFRKETVPQSYHPNSQKATDADLQAELVKKIKRETYRFTVSLVNANPAPVIIKEDQDIFIQNFYLTQCPGGVTGVRSFHRIVMKDIYPGIDWVLYSRNGGLVYDFNVHPGADPSLIKLTVKNTDAPTISSLGALEFKTPLGNIKEAAPVSFSAGEKIVSAFQKNADGTIGFAVGQYDRSKELIIDPVVSWSTYYGANGYDYGLSLALDNVGNIYESGQTSSAFNIASGGYQTSYGGGGMDAYLVKFTNSGARLWATYYGNSGDEWGYGCSTG